MGNSPWCELKALFTLEIDYPSETGYPWDNSRQTDNTYVFII